MISKRKCTISIVLPLLVIGLLCTQISESQSQKPKPNKNQAHTTTETFKLMLIIQRTEKKLNRKIQMIRTTLEKKLKSTNAKLKQLQKIIAPIGSVIPFAGPVSKIPTGWILCDGRALSSITHSKLYNVIGRSHGSYFKVNTVWFNIPDYRGRFLRGVSGESCSSSKVKGACLDKDVQKRKAMYKGGNKGNKVGSVQNDSTKRPQKSFRAESSGGHRHIVPAGRVHGKRGGSHNGWGGTNVTTGGTYAPSTSLSPSHKHKILGGDIETRPKNVYVNFIIRVN